MTVTFSELPLASAVGLRPAAAALDAFLWHRPPAGPQRAEWEQMNAAVVAFTPIADAVAAKLGAPPSADVDRAAVEGDVASELQQLGDVNSVALLNAASELWADHRQDVAAALDAETARQQWAARRQVNDSREARRQLRYWTQQARQLVPPATQYADRVAVAVNDAAQGVTPTPDPIRRVVPSWR